MTKKIHRSWFCPPQLLETIEGDLMEQFDEDVKLFGLAKAQKNSIALLYDLYKTLLKD